MSKTINVLSCLALFSLSLALSGCGEDKGQGFVGKWTGEDKERMFKPSFVMDISKDGEMFHVNLATTQDVMGYGKKETETQLFEAKAESDNVLSIAGGLVTMRLNGNVIQFDGTTYARSK